MARTAYPLRVALADFETVAGIPGEVPDAITEVIEKGDRPQKQQHHADRRDEKPVRRFK